MARLRGRGYAAVNYPTGMNLGGDPSQALIHSTTTGTFVVTLSSVDLGQGIKTIAAQCAAETLGLPYENVLVDTNVRGQMRKVLVNFDRNGFVYTLDRETGELLMAEPFVAVNATAVAVPGAV